MNPSQRPRKVQSNTLSFYQKNGKKSIGWCENYYVFIAFLKMENVLWISVFLR